MLAVLGSYNSLVVDLKGIEPSNLTDANRALSQLSYRPRFFQPFGLLNPLLRLPWARSTDRALPAELIARMRS